MNKETVTLNSEHVGFRDGTSIVKKTLNVLCNMGGLGDFICRIPALRQVAKSAPYVHFNFWCPEYFVSLAKYWTEDYSNVAVHDMEYFNDRQQVGESFIDFRSKLLLPLALDLVYHGFLILWQQLPTSLEQRMHPQMHRKAANIDRFNIPPNNVVVTCGATCKTRTWPEAEVQKTVQGLLDRGITPVILGRSKLHGDYKAEFPTLNTEGAINLIDKTSPLEAYQIISQSSCVMGVDNGLIHLAGCTETPIIAGFTNVNPKDRVIVRPRGKTLVITPPAELKCRFCQSNMKFLIAHDFRYCLYPKDSYACLDFMKAQDFLSALDEVLGEQ